MLRAALLALLLAAPVLAADPPKPENDKISRFVDETAEFKGKEVTFKLTFRGSSTGLDTLRDKVGSKQPAVFTGKDSKNGAELNVAVLLPAGLKVPAAKDGEEVVVKFKCGAGATDKGNVAVEIVRPDGK